MVLCGCVVGWWAGMGLYYFMDWYFEEQLGEALCMLFVLGILFGVGGIALWAWISTH